MEVYFPNTFRPPQWLDVKDVRLCSNPYIRLCRPTLDEDWETDEAFWVEEVTVIWQSEVVRKDLNPEFLETIVDLDDLGGSDMDMEVVLSLPSPSP